MYGENLFKHVFTLFLFVGRFVYLAVSFLVHICVGRFLAISFYSVWVVSQCRFLAIDLSVCGSFLEHLFCMYV